MWIKRDDHEHRDFKSVACISSYDLYCRILLLQLCLLRYNTQSETEKGKKKKITLSIATIFKNSKDVCHKLSPD